ncbi:MAG: YitT family protein [Oscillospiraceae bacterium]|nr:YitT family protein [Oscillospiraceae bacterium]
MRKIRDLFGKDLGKRLWKIFLIVLGSAVFGFAFQGFLFPNDIVSGGVTGIAMIVNAFTHWPIGMMVILMNIPLFLIAWRHFGLDFLLGSLLGMALSSAFIDLFALTGLVVTAEPMLASVIGGVIKGAGLGMVYYYGATTGGIDIVAKLLRQRFSQLNFGTVVLILDVVIIAVYAMIVGNYDSAMWSVITMFVTTKVIDLVLYGLDNSCTCHIISRKSSDLVKEITSGHMHRGVTILEGQGAYSGEKEQVILCVVKRHQIPELRRTIRATDENAFVIVTDAKNVFGRGFENISEIR